MRLKTLALGLAAILTLGGVAGAEEPWVFSASPDLIRAHMAYLASDEMKGRDAGTPEYDLAAAYVARQFQEMGLKPLGDDGSFLQAVTLVRHRPVDEGRIRLIGPRGPMDLVQFEDFRASNVAHGKDVRVAAPAVFAGFGVVAPNVGRDDFKDLDVRGKIVVVLDGAPAEVKAADRSFVMPPRNKALMAERHGAVGLIVVSATATPAVQSARPLPAPFSWTWGTRDGDAAYGGVPVLAQVGPAGAAKLFAGAPQSFSDIMAASRSPAGNPQRFDLPFRIEAFAKGEIGETRKSANVIAMIEGTDRRLKAEYIVMSGHLDHVAPLAVPVKGDAINNGALDNAGGIATLIEAARGFTTGPKPRRSVIFLAVTAEEKGLIGADYFVRNPTVPKQSIVADVNLDMPVMTYDFTDVAAIGAEHSTIVKAVEAATARMGVKVSPDPIVRLGIFTRSDHYRFVEQGIPAVFLVGGFENGGEKAFNDFYNNRYHRPGDDLNQAIDYAVAAKWARLNYEIARELADQAERPKWKKDNLFGGRFASADAIER